MKILRTITTFVIFISILYGCEDDYWDTLRKRTFEFSADQNYRTVRKEEIPVIVENFLVQGPRLKKKVLFVFYPNKAVIVAEPNKPWVHGKWNITKEKHLHLKAGKLNEEFLITRIKKRIGIAEHGEFAYLVIQLDKPIRWGKYNDDKLTVWIYKSKGEDAFITLLSEKEEAPQ